MAANVNASITLKLRNLMTGPAKQIQSSMRGISKSFARVKGGFDLAGQIGMAAGAAGQLGQQARGALSSILKPALDFEEAIARAGALTTGITDKQMADLTAAARKMGAETRFTATQAAEGLGQLAVAGFSAADQIKALPAILKLTQASGADMGRVADITSDLLGSFGKTADDTGEIAGVLAATFTSSTTTLETLFESLKLAGPIATKAGIPMRETAIMVGLLGNAGIKGSQAGTALKGMLLNLAGPAKKAKKALGQVGLTPQFVEDNLQKPTVILQKLAGAFESKGFSKAKKLAVLRSIFGKQQAAAAAVMLDAATKVGEDGSTAFENLSIAVDGTQTKLNQISSTMDKTGLASIAKMDSALESLKITLATELGPVVLDLVDDVREFAGTVSDWAKRNPGLVKDLGKLVVAAAAFGTILTPVLLAASALVSTITLMGLVAVPLTTALTLLRTVGLVTLKGPLTKAISGLDTMSDRMAKSTGATGKMAKAMKLATRGAGVLAAGFIGWGVGKVLDNVIGKIFDLRGELLSTELALQAGESSLFNAAVEGVGNLIGSETLINAAKGNRQANASRQAAEDMAGKGLAPLQAPLEFKLKGGQGQGPLRFLDTSEEGLRGAPGAAGVAGASPVRGEPGEAGRNGADAANPQALPKQAVEGKIQVEISDTRTRVRKVESNNSGVELEALQTGNLAVAN